MSRVMLGLLTLMFASALFAGQAEAACKLGGKMYPEGTTYSSYICKGGKWVKQR